MKTLKLDFEITLNNFHLIINESLNLKGITGIFGHSGSGKSTLLRVISGFEKNTNGEISFNNTCLLNSELNYFVKPENRQISLVFQDSRLFPHLTVYENLNFAASRCKNAQLKIEDIILLTDLNNLIDKPVTQLSSGQQQRVALARAILSEPQLLLLDEPLSALDQQSKKSLLTLIVKVQKQLNLSMLYVSHSLEELQQVCDDLVVLSQGKIINYGCIHAVIHQLNSLHSNNTASEIANVKDKTSNQTKLSHPQTSLSLSIKTYNNEHGFTVLSLKDGQNIYLHSESLALKEKAINTPQYLRCFIFAKDISLCLSKPIDSSIVNNLSGAIITIEQESHAVLITVLCGQQEFFVSISLYSHQKLDLSVKQAVYLQFKASAIRNLL